MASYLTRRPGCNHEQGCECNGGSAAAAYSDRRLGNPKCPVSAELSGQGFLQFTNVFESCFRARKMHKITLDGIIAQMPVQLRMT